MTGIVELEPFHLDQASQADLLSYYRISIAAQKVDQPDDVVLAFDDWIAVVRQPLAGFGARRLWIARCDGELVAKVYAYFPEGENDHIVLAGITVPPERRREGVGTAVLRALLPHLEATGRTVVEEWDLTKDGAGHRWAEAVGMRTAKPTVVLSLMLADVDPERWDVPVPDGYRVEDWTQTAPEELVASYARALAAMQDAPVGASDFQSEEWTVSSVRAAEAELTEGGVERRVVVAVHEATGEVAGLTQMDFYSTTPTWGFQQDTAVVASHRGHGLGLCVKAHMLRLLRAERPDVDRVHTNTHADNVHMLRVNHQIGFTTTRRTVAVKAKIAELRDLGA